MSKKILGALALTLASAMMTSSAMACTVYGIGKDATADGSTMVTHTCDSTSDDFRMWIIPEMEGGEGITADIVMNGNTWGDWSDYPNTKNYGSGMVMGEMPQPRIPSSICTRITPSSTKTAWRWANRPAVLTARRNTARR